MEVAGKKGDRLPVARTGGREAHGPDRRPWECRCKSYLRLTMPQMLRQRQWSSHTWEQWPMLSAVIRALRSRDPLSSK